MRSWLDKFFAPALFAVLLALSGEALGAAPPPNASRPPVSAQAQYVPDEVLVTFKPGISTQASKSAVAALSGTTLATVQPGVLHVKLKPGQTVKAALAAYGADPSVQAVQPNFIYHIQAVPASTQYGQLWGFKNTGQTIAPPAAYVQGEGWVYPTNNPGVAGNDMDIEPAWGIITDCSSAVVAVVDTGINYNQQDLAANMWVNASYPNHGINYTAEGAANDPMDYNGHGTHVAGIIGAAGTVTNGVCWKASIMAVRVADSAGSSTTSLITKGINFAVANGAKVINISMGGSGNDPLLSTAISNAQASDVVVVVAAGNNTANNDAAATPTYPCNYTQANLVCVAALDQSYQMASFSNYGSTSVDVGAPGTNILSTFAGASTYTVDPLNAGWAFATTSFGAGWGYATANGGTLNILADPVTTLSGTNYGANTIDTANKTFNLSGANVAVLSSYHYISLATGSTFYLNYSTNGTSFVTATSTPGPVGPLLSNGVFWSGNISPCISATCTVQYKLTSGTSVAQGPVVTYMALSTLTWNNTSYNTLNGTSMATPEVAGLATMLRAYNPKYTYADTVAAIKNAGRPTASLSGKTTTGKAVDAMASLAYINPPTGLTATIQ